MAITWTIEGLWSNKWTLVGDTLTFYWTIKRYVGEAKNLVKVKLTAPEAFDTVGTTVKVGTEEAVAWSSLDTESNWYIEFNFEVKEADIWEDFDILTTWEGEDTQTFTIAYDSDAVLETIPAPEPIKGIYSSNVGVFEEGMFRISEEEIPRIPEQEKNLIQITIEKNAEFDTSWTMVLFNIYSTYNGVNIQDTRANLVNNEWKVVLEYEPYESEIEPTGNSIDGHLHVNWNGFDEESYWISIGDSTLQEPYEPEEPIKGTIAATGGVVEDDTVTFAGEIPRDADAEANVITLEITAPDDYDTQNTTIQKIGDELVLNWSELDPEDTGVVYLAYDVTEDNIWGSDDIKVTWEEWEEQTFYIIYSETMTIEPEDKPEPEPEEEENHITSTKQRQRPSEFPNIDHSRLTQEEYMLVIGNSTLKKWSDYKRWIRGYQSELDEINDNENVSEEEKALCTSILNKHNAL